MRATRCVYSASADGDHFDEQLVDFPWSSGRDPQIIRENFANFRKEIERQFQGLRHLEVSTFANTELGYQLSAFNLGSGAADETVECLYQQSKIYVIDGVQTFIGPVSGSLDAKRKAGRLSALGKLSGFVFGGSIFGIEKSIDIYNLIYWNALENEKSLLERASAFEVFSDFAFNKNRLGIVLNKSNATQARSIAIAVAAFSKGISINELNSQSRERLFATRPEMDMLF